MNLPLNDQTSTNVEILCLTPSGPVMFMGRARTGAEDEIDIDLSKRSATRSRRRSRGRSRSPDGRPSQRRAAPG